MIRVNINQLIVASAPFIAIAERTLTNCLYNVQVTPRDIMGAAAVGLIGGIIGCYVLAPRLLHYVEGMRQNKLSNSPVVYDNYEMI